MSEVLLESLNLHKTFGGVVAVDNLTFLVNQGTIMSVIGPNGAGKTTIFNMITGFIPATRGNVYFDGREISGKSTHKIASLGIARTFQHVQIFSNMTVLENVMVGRHTKSHAGMLTSSLLPSFMRGEERRIRESAKSWLEFVGLQDQADKSAGDLPIGSQRLLEIARALAMEPKLLLLDEPASGLNTRETLTVANYIQKINEMGVTVILVEHDMDLVMDISDNVMVINYGKRLAEGTPSEVQANKEVVTAYLGDD